MKNYNPSEIEAKWQKVWDKEKTYSPNLDKAKKPFYNLMMFPYPSAEGMHVGNMYAFTGADVYGRFMRMKGYDVFEPMGLDGFGIHSENYAIKVGRHPKEQAKVSESNFYRQLHEIGNSFDWSRKVETYDPAYYKWTQWIFIQMYKAGLAYRKKAQVNWCPSDKTVLADEQVIDGKCERDGAVVEKRELEQWFFKITKYADRLLDNIEGLNWSEKVKIAQKQWIGKSEGMEIGFPIDNKFNYIILHGHKGTPDSDFHPWLKKELEKTGAKVEVPQLPGGSNPKIEDQVQYLLKNLKFDEKTVLVTHSLGGVTALKLLPRLKTKIAKLVMVAPPLRTEFLDGKARKELVEAADWRFDFDSVKNKANEIIVIRDTKDDVVFASHPQEIAEKLSAELIDVTANVPHFNSKTEPEVFAEVLPQIVVYTVFPETIYGVTYMVLAPEHKLASVLTTSEQKSEVEKYIKEAKSKTETERLEEGKVKTGVFSGSYCINPVNGQKIPVWIADYVLAGYGTGGVMGVPGSDHRDFEFAKEYNLPIVKVIGRSKGDISEIKSEQDVLEEGFLVNSDKFSGLSAPNPAREKIKDFLVEKGFGKRKIQYHLRDWLISRQRYWGPPIPMIYCEKPPSPKTASRGGCGWNPVPEKDLPVLLPDVKDWKPKGTGKSPLASIESFVNTKCPNCGGSAKRETDVSDTFLDSAWYFFRYVSTEFNDKVFDDSRVKKWLPVNMYIGGAEHSVLHLLYSRFLTMVFKDLKLISHFEEPFSRFYAHGLLLRDGAKMSKSKGNVVVPDEYIKKYGADTLRCCLMFSGPFSQGGDFRDSGIEGMSRFLKRVWKLLTEAEIVKTGKIDPYLMKLTQEITEEVENLRYNTAISRLMMYYNFLFKKKTGEHPIYKIEIDNFVKMIAPFSPHMAEEIWELLGEKLSIHIQNWPAIDEKELGNLYGYTVPIQVNGKTRAVMDMEELLPQKEVERRARTMVAKYLEGKKVVKTIYVEGKIINFVTN